MVASNQFVSRGGMHNEDVPLGSNVNTILVAAPMLLDAEISGILPAIQKQTYDFIVHTALGLGYFIYN